MSEQQQQNNQQQQQQSGAWFTDPNKEFVEGKGWKTGDDAITSYKNLETLVGADKAGRTVILPKDENDVEGTKTFRAKLGVPEKPEDYQLPLPAGAKEPDAFLKHVTGVFHKHGLTKAQAQAIAKEVNDFDAKLLSDTTTRLQADSQQQLDALNTEWGTAAKGNTELARRFVRELGASEEDVVKIEAALGTAKMLKMFHAGGKKLGEHNVLSGDMGGGGMTQADARAKLEEARAKRANGEMNERDWVEIMDRLSPIANGQAKAA